MCDVTLQTTHEIQNGTCQSWAQAQGILFVEFVGLFHMLTALFTFYHSSV